MARKSKPRDRLVETASRLFYERGLPNVGVNEVTDCAGVARMTLYNNFRSKEDLALAAMAYQSRERRDLLEDLLRKAKDGEGKIAALFEVARRLARKPNFRGCAFVNVVAQVPDQQSRLYELVRSHKLWVREKIQEIASEEGVAKGDQLAQQILCLWDGSIMEAYIQDSQEPIDAAQAAALVVFAAQRDPHEP